MRGLNKHSGAIASMVRSLWIAEAAYTGHIAREGTFSSMMLQHDRYYAYKSSAQFDAEVAKARRQKRIIFINVTGLIALSIGMVMYLQQESERIEKEKLAKLDKSVGKAAVGGPFVLVDQDGKRFTDGHLLDQFTLLYFGFTHCPDICPDEMEKAAKIVDLVEETTGQQITPLFVTVDPERDGPQQIKSYVKEFHPRMIGLTGPMEDVKKMCKSFRVYYSKTDEENDGKDYLIDHSIIMYLLNPEANFHTFYGKNFTADDVASSIAGHIEQWSKSHKNYPPQHSVAS